MSAERVDGGAEVFWREVRVAQGLFDIRVAQKLPHGVEIDARHH